MAPGRAHPGRAHPDVKELVRGNVHHTKYKFITPNLQIKRYCRFPTFVNLTTEGLREEPNMFHNHETEKITRKARHGRKPAIISSWRAGCSRLE